MTPQSVLTELLHRLGERHGPATFISALELSRWPASTVNALKAEGLLLKARPASHLECPGCERKCVKPVELYPSEDGRPTRAYIVCDETEDMGRIPLDLAELEQWRMSNDASPTIVARTLGVTLASAKAGAVPSRQAQRDDEIRRKYEELAQAGKRNYVKEIQRTVQGAQTLSDRRIRTIVKGC